jgi:AcrR family transcriptional regulator
MSAAPTTRPRGRPPAATHDEVVGVAMRHYLRGERIDVQAVAADSGVGRTTIYRWFGSREGLIGEVLARAAEPLLEQAHARTRARGGRGLLDTFDRFNRSLAGARALRTFVEAERETAMRIIASGSGVVQPRIVARIAELIEAEAAAGRYEPPVEPAILAYAIVKLAEAFLLGDADGGMRDDIDRLRSVEAALLGVPAARGTGERLDLAP